MANLSRLEQSAARTVRQARRLWHMLVGTVFLFLAMAGAAVTYAEWQFYQRMPETGWVRFALLAGFTVMLLVLGLYTFAKARSVR